MDLVKPFPPGNLLHIIECRLQKYTKMKINIEAVVFDMDGVMFDTEPVYKCAWQGAASELGYAIHDDLYMALIGKNNADSEKAIVEVYGAGFPLTEFRGLWRRKWRELIESEGVPFKSGLVELLDLLGLYRIPAGVATSSDQDEVHLLLQTSGLIQRFKCIITGDLVAQGKPAPDIYLEAARQLEVEPASCVALEDSNSGALSAISAGMNTIVIPDLSEPTDEVISLSFDIVPSLAEAKHIIECRLKKSGHRVARSKTRC